MERLSALSQKVCELYFARNPKRESWADWLFENHIFVVADIGAELARLKAADPELASAAGMLHDIADAVMDRFDEGHEKQSLQIAQQLLVESGFTVDEISTIVDAIKYHGCHGAERPESTEGLCMAAADALAHLETDFYQHAFDDKSRRESREQIKEWGLAKIDRDYLNKIAWDDIRERARVPYEKWKKFFSSLTESAQ